MSGTVASKSFMLLGRCIPCVKQNASKFKVKRFVLDTHLNIYFPEEEVVYAHDPKKICKTGDVALIQELPEKLTRLITHKVLRVVYPLGDIVDPLTGKPVVFNKYRDQIKAENELYGINPEAFDYDKAPPRGWQEGKRDFTHVDLYVKYSEFEGEDQPHAV